MADITHRMPSMWNRSSAILHRAGLGGKAYPAIDKGTTKADIEGLKRAIDRLNVQLRFEVQWEDHRVVLKLIDPETKRLIRQIPEQELIDIYKRLEELKGIIYDRES